MKFELFFNAPTCPCGLRGLPSWAWQKCNRLLSLFLCLKKQKTWQSKTILQQNNLSHIEDPVLNIKFIKSTFKDSRHGVIEVSPNLRKELVALQKIKLHWDMCKFEDFVVVTRCLKCLGFGYTSRFCQNQQKCSRCAEDHHWKECGHQHPIRCSGSLRANSYIQDESKKINTNHSVFSKE